MNKMNKIVVVGGGTAGSIASTYIKKYWGDNVEVILLYDHSKPNIGIGESLTPQIYSYLNYVGITREELIQNVNATVKLGIKFKNWGISSSEFYHPFTENPFDGVSPYNFLAAFDISNGLYDYDTCYSKYYFDTNRIPTDPNASQSLHIDGVLFGKYLTDKFKNDLTIIDGVVKEVILKHDSEEIDYLFLEDGSKIHADFFIDATGFQAVLFNKLNSNWIDKSDWCPLDRCIPKPIFTEHAIIPVYTTAEASKDGWILNVPLSNRWGCGYLYSSKFTSDEDAINSFSNFLDKTYSEKLTSPKIIPFKSGYWKRQWIGNCIAVGLASGFAEPLEATNIHQLIYQIKQFIDVYNFKSYEFDANNYNQLMETFYERVYTFIRFCYSSGRTDSNFWKYMTETIPYEVRLLEEKIKTDPLNTNSMNRSIFNYENFTKIAYGLNKIDIPSYHRILNERHAYELGRNDSEIVRNIRRMNVESTVDHTEYIRNILCVKNLIKN